MLSFHNQNIGIFGYKSLKKWIFFFEEKQGEHLEIREEIKKPLLQKQYPRIVPLNSVHGSL